MLWNEPSFYHHLEHFSDIFLVLRSLLVLAFVVLGGRGLVHGLARQDGPDPLLGHALQLLQAQLFQLVKVDVFQDGRQHGLQLGAVDHFEH